LHHALLLRGWSVGQTAALAAGLTAITCVGAIASYFTGQDWIALAAAVGVFFALATTRVFGHAEVALVASQVKSVFRRMLNSVRPAAADQPHGGDQEIQIQGRRQWNILWAALREAAPTYNLAGLKLNVNIPNLHESFYATWKMPGRTSDDAWKLSLPLTYGDRPIGKLTILGSSTGAEALAEMQFLLEFLQPLEAEIGRIVEEVQPASPSPLFNRRSAAVGIPATSPV
jgi:hypothetical protein